MCYTHVLYLHTTLKHNVTQVFADPKLFNLADEHLFPGLATVLSASLDQLERCQKVSSHIFIDGTSSIQCAVLCCDVL
jgi:hypothetical protein